MPALLAAVLLSAVPLAADRAALLDVLRGERDTAGCSSAELQAAAGNAAIDSLGQTRGKRVVLASPHAACMCGNVNCPWFVLQLGGSHPDVMLLTYAYDVRAFGTAAPLPNLREHAHDSALISYETVDAFRNGRYAPISVARVRGDTGERKFDNVPVRFAAGASSAILRGSVSFDWYDSYALAALRGQRLTITDVHPSSGLTLSLLGAAHANQIDVRPGSGVTLPASATYTLQVDTSSERPTHYALTVRIR